MASFARIGRQDLGALDGMTSGWLTMDCDFAVVHDQTSERLMVEVYGELDDQTSERLMVEVYGELDLASAPRLESELEKAWATDPPALVLA